MYELELSAVNVKRRARRVSGAAVGAELATGLALADAAGLGVGNDAGGYASGSAVGSADAPSANATPAVTAKKTAAESDAHTMEFFTVVLACSGCAHAPPRVGGNPKKKPRFHTRFLQMWDDRESNPDALAGCRF